ncbi:MAG TPA: TonB-dependent receptor [Steroidobacteraceae bacterium]|nr:TonB-dependent receptor [Steroidobacteraceae bacterium]
MTRSRKRKLRRSAAHWAGLPIATAAFACSSVASAQQSDTGAGLEEIIVTAQKRVEDVQKVPISVQVLGGEKLDQLQVSNFIDYAKFLPSLSFQTLGPGQSQVYFRGISTGYSNLHAGYLPSTGTYLDETPVTTISGVLDVHMYDIQRVEGLAGPQGTLYGASSLAGTLRIITNKPDPKKFEAGYDVKGSLVAKGDSGGSFEGFVNLPAGDHAAIRLVGYYDHAGGYIDNVPHTISYLRTDANGVDHPGDFTNAAVAKNNYNDVDNYGGRAELRLELNDSWTVSPTVIYQNQRANGDFSFDPKLGDLKVADMRPIYNYDRWTQSALTVTGKLAQLDVVYSGSWFQRHVDNEYDYSGYSLAYDYCCYTYLPADPANPGPDSSLPDPTQYVQNHDDYTKMSHEIRISTPADWRTRLIAGAFTQRQTDAIRAEFRVDGISSYYYVDRNPGILYLSDQDRTDRDSAVFADLTHDFTDHFKVSAGIREFQVDNTLYGFFGYNNILAHSDGERTECAHDAAGNVIPAPAGATRPCVNTNSREKESGETHRVNLTYQIDPNRMVYATYSTGYRPGGNNRRPSARTWKADTLTNYELGWKTSWANNRVRFNGAVFHENWKNVQVAIQGLNGVTSIVNAGDARTEGFESDINWLATDNLTLGLSGTYLKANTTTDFCKPTPLGVVISGQDNCDVTGLASQKGTQLPGTPKTKANATARYHFNVNGFQSFAQLAAVYQASTTFSLLTRANNIVGDTPAYASFDVSIGTGKDNWTLEGFVNNVTDKRGELARVSECADPAGFCYSNYRIVPINPLTFGIKFGQKF